MNISEKTEFQRKQRRIQNLDEISIRYLSKIRYIQKL